VDGLKELRFDVQHRYEESESGILVPVRLSSGSGSVALRARLDTGAADCLFDQHYADLLGINVESGYRRIYRTVTGSFPAFGHEIVLQTMGMEWEAMVFFHSFGDPRNAFLGRRGWLDRIRLALIHYDREMFLSRYDL
jgi:hypothetical protein